MSRLVLRAMSEMVDVIQPLNRNNYLSKRKPALFKNSLYGTCSMKKKLKVYA